MTNAKATLAKPRTAARSRSLAASVLAQSSVTGEFKVVLQPKTRKTLAGHEAQVMAMMEVLGDTIAESQKSGRARGFLIEVDNKGRPRILPAPPPAANRKIAGRAAKAEAAADGSADELERALDAARERGRLRAAEVLSAEDMLSAEDFADLLGVSRVTVNTKRQKYEVLALDGAKRGFRFPAWQIDENGKPFQALPKLFEHLGDSPWAVYRFLMQRHPELDGVRALDALRRGRTADVIAAAESLAQGALG